MEIINLSKIKAKRYENGWIMPSKNMTNRDMYSYKDGDRWYEKVNAVLAYIGYIAYKNRKWSVQIVGTDRIEIAVQEGDKIFEVEFFYSEFRLETNIGFLYRLNGALSHNGKGYHKEWLQYIDHKRMVIRSRKIKELIRSAI